MHSLSRANECRFLRLAACIVGLCGIVGCSRDVDGIRVVVKPHTGLGRPAVRADARRAVERKLKDTGFEIVEDEGLAAMVGEVACSGETAGHSGEFSVRLIDPAERVVVTMYAFHSSSATHDFQDFHIEALGRELTNERLRSLFVVKRGNEGILHSTLPDRTKAAEFEDQVTYRPDMGKPRCRVFVGRKPARGEYESLRPDGPMFLFRSVHRAGLDIASAQTDSDLHFIHDVDIRAVGRGQQSGRSYYKLVMLLQLKKKDGSVAATFDIDGAPPAGELFRTGTAEMERDLRRAFEGEADRIAQALTQARDEVSKSVRR